ncbi:UDP-N-acetylglucosamine--N-acetylmuramyl-(pentapeptide) pyrophosphoryl-undecaprenol N-acetylglucosamine transferase, partial [Magnetococcales bacterium HHB-1]
ISDMASAYQQADLVICRAGATSLAEITLFGKPALLIPYPFAADDHQTANARVLEKNDAGWLCAQNDFTPEWLSQFLKTCIEKPQQGRIKGVNAKKLGAPQAAEQIIETILAHS